LAPVLNWLAREKRYAVPGDLLELAEAAMRVNATLGALRADDETREEIRALLALGSPDPV
jgi:UDP-N-acetylmuramyl pentapeptide synthase